jgi:hypothetical protein
MTSIEQISTIGMQFGGGAPGSWNYPYATEGGGGIDVGFGFKLHDEDDAADLAAAGLTMQEHLSVELEDQGTVAPPEMAVNWYELDNGDGFLTPTPDNFGVLITGEAGAPFDRPSRFYSSGWQNSPITSSAKEFFYPEQYARFDAKFRRMNALHRWVGGPGVGALGGNDGTISRPPTGMILAWATADDVPVASGDRASSWPDRSGRMASFDQPDASHQPLVTRNALNGHAKVAFVAGRSDAMIQSASVTLFQPAVVFMVIASPGSSSGAQVWAGNFNGGAPLIYRDTDGIHLWLGGSDLIGAQSWPMAPAILTFLCDGATSKIWRNKTLLATGNAGANNLPKWRIGSGFGTLPSTTDFYDMLVVGKTMSDVEREAVIDWYGTRYGITV